MTVNASVSTRKSVPGGPPARGGAELAERLFVPWERLGWEYVQPAPPAPSPEADRAPVWVDPLGRPPAAWPGTAGPWAPPPPAPARSSAGAALPLGGCGSLVLAFFLIGGIVAYGGTVAMGVAAVLVVGVATAVVPGVRKRMVKARFQRERDLALAAYELELARWRERVARHDEAERRRYAAAERWYPLTPRSEPERIDVFGGTSDGWASLLTTVGCSLLATGADALVLDFTEQGVGDDLAAFAAQQGSSVRQLTLPDEWSRWHPLAGLEADELAELLADVVSGVRASAGSAGTADSRALDTELFGTVLARLDRPWTHRRLAAGLRVLRRLHDPATQTTLKEHETELLTGAIDAVGHSAPVEQELQFLTSVLDLLAAMEPHDVSVNDDGRDVLTAAGLAVVRTAGRQARRKDVLDRVVFHRVIRALHDRARKRGTQFLVVAGADHLGRDPLEELVRQAERSGVRLVLMFERLRGDLHGLLGGRDSATLLMRLGNAREATTAAEFVGRDHTFVLSQLTQQVGATFTEGVAASRGVTTGESQNSSISLSDGHFGKVSVPFASASRSMSVNTSRSDTWQNTVNQSVAESTTTGRTVSRVYEFTVEPTTVQSLPATAFVLVEVGPRGRRVALGDCNPGIALLDRVASAPREL